MKWERPKTWTDDQGHKQTAEKPWHEELAERKMAGMKKPEPLMVIDRGTAEKEPEPAWEVGMQVSKISGYEYRGVIVAVFKTTEGNTRLVVENYDSIGMLHIFSPNQMAIA